MQGTPHNQRKALRYAVFGKRVMGEWSNAGQKSAADGVDVYEMTGRLQIS